MNYAACFLVAFVILGSTTADEETTVACTVTPPEGKLMNDTIFDLSTACFDVITKHRDELIKIEKESGAQAKDRIGFVYRKVCTEDLPPYKVCVEKAEKHAVACLNTKEHLKHRLFSNFLSLEFELDCANDAHRLAINLEAAVKEKADGTPNPMNKCLDHGYKSKPANDGEGDDDVNASMFFEYRLFQRTLKCLEGYRGTGQDHVVDAGVSLWGDLIDKMVCADAQGHDVFCKTLVSHHE